MTPQQWTEIEALFDSVADLPAADRDHALADVDPLLRAEVLKLFAAESSGPALDEAIREGEQLLQAAQPNRFGNYRVEGIIGHGGMGTVYKAVRDDQAFDKLVAIKVLQLGADTPQTRERFQQERRILAGLEHPNIARLIDGGETGDNLSYIVLEYVDGEDILAYCTHRNLSREDRLRLFIKVCAAVQFAHQSLVVHRDLKPGNILVTQAGEPKLLDFGIAKLIDSDAARTQTGFQALTPAYASPEQVRGDSITTASDVYSLGVVLYELLTGRKPYVLATASPIEIAQTVCETAPASPAVSDDLDNILLMALRKEPARRYASVKEFAEDIERSMQSLPVRARPDTIRYRTQKFIRRNWWQVAAVAAIIVSLGAGLGFTLAEKRLAERRFDEVRELANRFLFDFYDEIAATPGTVKAKEMVVSTALKYLTNLSADGTRDPGLQWEMAVAYAKVAAAQGSVTKPSLGRTSDAIQSFEKAIALARPLAAGKVLNPSQHAAFVELLCDAAVIYRTQKDTAQAERLGREAESHSAGLALPARRRALRELSITLSQVGDVSGGVAVLERLLALMREAAASKPSDETKRDLAITLLTIGYSQLAAARLEDSAKSLNEALGLFHELSAKTPQNTRITRSVFMTLMYLGQTEGVTDKPSFDRPEAAVARMEEALAVIQPMLAADSADRSTKSDAALVHDMIACALRERKPEVALRHAAISAELMDAASPKNYEERAMARIMSADAQRKLNHYAQSDQFLQEAGRILAAGGLPLLPDAKLSLARLELARGNQPLARRRFAEAIAAYEKDYAQTQTPGKAWLLAHALELDALAIPDSAEARRQRIAAVWQQQLQRDPGNRYLMQQLERAKK